MKWIKEQYTKFAVQKTQKYYDDMVLLLFIRLEQSSTEDYADIDKWFKKELDTIAEQLIQDSKTEAGGSDLLLQVLTDFILMAKEELLHKFKEELGR